MGGAEDVLPAEDRQHRDDCGGHDERQATPARDHDREDHLEHSGHAEAVGDVRVAEHRLLTES
jgi:hypothetical protein